MYCPNCGNQLSDDARFCNACGTAVQTEAKAEPAYQEPVYEEPVVVEEQKHAKCWSVFAKISKILGIISIALCWIQLLSFCTTSIPGIVFGCLGKGAHTEDADKMRKIGITLSIIGGIISIVIFLIRLLLPVVGKYTSGIDEYSYFD